jgi:phage FluMu protein Com
MKTTFNAIRLLLATAAFGAFALSAHAGPGPQHWATLHNDSDFKQLKTGDKVAMVCNMCKTVSEVAIESEDQAMKLCKEGATVTCPSCKMTAKVTMKRGRNDSPTQTTYVNDKGEDCMFIAKVVDKS